MRTNTKWKIAIAVSWIIFLAFLHTVAFGDDHKFILEEFDSDIDRLGKHQREILNDLVDLRILVAHVTDHHHENQEHRLRELENEIERLHGASNITMWVTSIPRGGRHCTC